MQFSSQDGNVKSENFYIIFNKNFHVSAVKKVIWYGTLNLKNEDSIDSIQQIESIKGNIMLYI